MDFVESVGTGLLQIFKLKIISNNISHFSWIISHVILFICVISLRINDFLSVSICVESEISPVFWSSLCAQLKIIFLINSNWGIQLVIIFISMFLDSIDNVLSVSIFVERKISPVFWSSCFSKHDIVVFSVKLCCNSFSLQLEFIFLINSNRSIWNIVIFISIIVCWIMDVISMGLFGCFKISPSLWGLVSKLNIICDFSHANWSIWNVVIFIRVSNQRVFDIINMSILGSL